MRNWLCQDIQVGDVVFRGARAGNNSEFKIGVVVKLVEKDGHGTRRARVEWKYAAGHCWRKNPNQPNPDPTDRQVVRKAGHEGTVSIDTLVKMSKDDLVRAERAYGFARDFYESSMTARELELELDSLP